ncbi:MAG: hypothetical protein ORN58_04620, partial [Sediminibacterium sp.]|nr:hypothetical protein [Sediminibacterium sp.]
TNRFGNNYAASKYYVDWVGTNLRLNPNIPFKEITGYSKDILLQRNNTNNPYTVINPLIANTTDAPQYTVVNDPHGIIYYNTTPTITSRPKNTYLSDLNVVFLYTLSGDTSIALNTLNYVNVPERNNDLNLVNTIGNSIITLNSKAPSGRYTFDAKLINSLNAPSVDNDNYGVKTFSIILADSLKAVNYAAQNYVKTAFKAINSGSPVIIGNDGSVRAIRYQMLVRRNGIDITNLYAFNAANLDVSTSNRPIGVDSVFLTYTGWFNEEVKDTLIFSFVYTKPSIKYTPNESNDFSLINARANFTPIVLDSGGKTLTYSFLTANANFTISPQTGKITVVNWENLAAGNSAELKIVASNGTYLDTAIFTYTKTLQDRVLYFSNSSYRTQSTNGGDYIQLP